LRRNTGFVIAGVIAAASLVGMIVLIASHVGSGGAAVLPFGSTVPAPAPFSDFRAGRVAVGGRCLNVLVATTDAQRSQGLRDVTNLAPYDGMIFVYANDTNTNFTMANTKIPLDITWYASDGAPVDHTTMEPCPNGTDATCPVYSSKHKYRYALEQPAGAPGGGTLGACAA
jgi:uncharacterized membrane protein (UPF0127 family)